MNFAQKNSNAFLTNERTKHLVCLVFTLCKSFVGKLAAFLF